MGPHELAEPHRCREAPTRLIRETGTSSTLFRMYRVGARGQDRLSDLRSDDGRGAVMDSIRNELRQAVRRLVRAPLFTIITLVTLAAGVGANTLVFSVLEGVLLKPLPYPRPDELVGVWHTAAGLNIDNLNMAPSNYFIYREQGQTLQDIGIYQGDSVSITGTSEPEKVDALDVTDATLPLLGIPPMLGRYFSKQDDSPGAPDTAILSYGYWQRKFGSDPAIVGKTILVDGKSRQIIGVM